ncbi:MAG: phosphoglycolate phosphatase-like HAD superfamily hydrolase [Myxococcota bacterium]|jgi:phosphoglycolate phosphatase-like HAD superfamily hydrolase
MKILALDFDGVIFDSAPECFWVATRTLQRVEPSEDRGRRLSVWDELPPREVRANLIADPAFSVFIELMPLGNRAEDFGVSLLAFEAGVRPGDQRAYDRYFDSLDPAFASGFHANFYNERAKLRAENPERWGDLMRPFQGLVDVLRKRRSEALFVVATAKDGESVAKLLARFDIADLFEKDGIFEKERGRDKRAHLRAIKEQFQVDFAEISFVDDKVNHLIGVSGLGVRSFLASWGYNGLRECDVAAANGIGVCGLEQIEEVLFS